MDKKYQVFVSSTYEDLQEERKKVMEALLQMNCFPVGMEFFNASDESQWDVIRSLIDECDYYVLIIAGRYGSIDESTGKSYTQKEYEYALSINIPTIAFLHKDVSFLPKAKTETNQLVEQKLESFKNDVKKHLCKFWETSDSLAAQVVLSLNQLIKSKPRTGWVRADLANSQEANAEIVKLRKQIDDLNGKIHQFEDNAPAGVEDLAQGDDIIDIFYTDSVNSLCQMSLSWNDLIALLAPHMISECSELEMKDALNDEATLVIHEGMGKKRITESSFQDIKVQLIALGIMRESTKVHSTANTNVYWSLTPYGYRVMMTLKAIKKKS